MGEGLFAIDRDRQEMSTFSEISTKLLVDYKNLLKRHHSPAERDEKLNKLGLARKQVKHNDEITLYRLITHVIKDVEHWVSSNVQTASWYSGVDEFLQHMKAVVAPYRLDGNKIIHITQAASRAVVEAIQLMSLPDPRLTPAIAHQLNNSGLLIVKYGTKEQQGIYINGLKARAQRNLQFFLPLIDHYHKHWEEHVASSEMEYCTDSG